jgi:hypothetical protein
MRYIYYRTMAHRIDPRRSPRRYERRPYCNRRHRHRHGCERRTIQRGHAVEL